MGAVPIQNYYTREATATAIGAFFKNRIHSWKKDEFILDLCAGSGNLAKGVTSYYARDEQPAVHSVEIEEEGVTKLIKKRTPGRDQVFFMSAEEYARTHAVSEKFTLVLCNPPFSERCGRSSLDENLREMHLPELAYFESYFLHLATELSNDFICFILPDSYAQKAEAKTTMMHMARRGWRLDYLRALPVNGFHGATVNTSMWIWQKQRLYGNETKHEIGWVDRALTSTQNETNLPILSGMDITTVKGRFGDITGPKISYLLSRKEANWKTDTRYEWSDVEKVMGDVASPYWTPKKLDIGSQWKRQGAMYELTEQGWKLSNQDGWCNGQPVDKAFDRARLAFECLKIGAINCAKTIAHQLDLNTLKENYADIAHASFIELLPQEQIEDALYKDLQTHALLTLPQGFDLPINYNVSHIGNTVFLKKKLTLAQKCQIFIEEKDHLNEATEQSLRDELKQHKIGFDQCNLRSPWIPRTALAKYFELKIDETGFFQEKSCGYLPNHSKIALAAYLNRGKKQRLNSSYETVFDAYNLQFNQMLNNWDMPEHDETRMIVHAHFHHAHAKKSFNAMAHKAKYPTARTPHQWQREDLAFSISGENFLCWDVGLGKTTGGIMAAMNHPGLAVIVVPKSVLAKWYREGKQCYPDANIQLIGAKYNEKTGKCTADKTPLAKRVGEVFFDPTVDFVITTYEIIRQITVNKLDKVLADENAALDLLGADDSRSGIRSRELYIQRAAERNFVGEGTDFNWSDLPLSSMMVIVDEAHYYKSLMPMPGTGWGESLIMSGSCSVSKSARDIQIKFDLMRQQGGKTLALTATPITNSVAECFSMLRIFSPSVLRQRGIRNVQQFMDQYCILESKTAITVSGKVVHGKAIVGFTNLNDLKQLWSDAMRTRTAASEGLVIPKAVEEIIEISQTWGITAFIDEQRASITEAIKDEEAAHIFKVMHQIHKCATYPPIVGINDNPKAEEVLKQVHNHYQAGGNQIIFVDLKEAQKGYKELLIEDGIHEKEIAIIDGSTSLQRRLTIQDHYNQGKIRIVIGGAAASVGIDLQVGTTAIHHVSLSWEGETMHQRNGRGVRQGNKEEKVQIYYYVLQGSTDIYRLATIQTKRTWWNSLREAQTDDVREGIFSEPLSDEMIASMASDPDEALKELTSQRRKRENEAEFSTYNSVIHQMQFYLEDADRDILVNLEKRLRRLKWISRDIVDEAMLRVDTARLAMINEEEKYLPDYYLAYGIKWKDMAHLTYEAHPEFLVKRDAFIRDDYKKYINQASKTFISEEDEISPSTSTQEQPAIAAEECKPSPEVKPDAPITPKGVSKTRIKIFEDLINQQIAESLGLEEIDPPVFGPEPKPAATTKPIDWERVQQHEDALGVVIAETETHQLVVTPVIAANCEEVDEVLRQRELENANAANDNQKASKPTPKKRKRKTKKKTDSQQMALFDEPAETTKPKPTAKKTTITPKVRVLTIPRPVQMSLFEEPSHFKTITPQPKGSIKNVAAEQMELSFG